ncbi:hypothetical protein V6N13_039928 [Hibiscus sabdariffa]|uniref:Uncharacterized protein n=1 Tax=Hibiscus sabdariffa TaxID=183260 RepID=A0ABR2STY7_9ROSI
MHAPAEYYIGPLFKFLRNWYDNFWWNLGGIEGVSQKGQVFNFWDGFPLFLLQGVGMCCFISRVTSSSTTISLLFISLVSSCLCAWAWAFIPTSVVSVLGSHPDTGGRCLCVFLFIE